MAQLRPSCVFCLRAGKQLCPDAFARPCLPITPHLPLPRLLFPHLPANCATPAHLAPAHLASPTLHLPASHLPTLHRPPSTCTPCTRPPCIAHLAPAHLAPAHLAPAHRLCHICLSHSRPLFVPLLPAPRLLFPHLPASCATPAHPTPVHQLRHICLHATTHLQPLQRSRWPAQICCRLAATAWRAGPAKLSSRLVVPRVAAAATAATAA